MSVNANKLQDADVMREKDELQWKCLSSLLLTFQLLRISWKPH